MNLAKLLIAVLMGGLIGILVNYLADVLPISRRLSRPICLGCGKPFSLREYLFSFKCSKCGNRTALRVMLVLLISILVSVLLLFFPLFGLSYWAALPVLAFLGLVLVVDIEYRVVLIQTSIFGLILMFIYGFILHGFVLTLVGGIAGFLIMLLLYLLGILFNKIAGKIRKTEIDEVALGFGDVYVCAFLGFLTGWPTIIGAILIAILASGAFSLVYIIVKLITRRYQSFSAIPYTPFLILGALATFYIL